MQQPLVENSVRRNVLIFVICVLIVFLFRSLWTYPTDHFDSLQKHLYALEILKTGDWSLLLRDHHTLRWAAMFPQIGLTWLLGARFEILYILPLLMFSLYVVLMVFSLRNILNTSQLLLLGTILLTEIMGFHVSNHYSIVGLGIFFAFAGTLTLVRQGTHQNLSVIFSAIFFFIAYGAHVTYLGFAGGGFLWLLMCRRKPSQLVIFCATILLLMLMETLIFNYLSDWQLTLGRVEALAHGKHVVRSQGNSAVSTGQLLSRWLLLPKPDFVLCLLFFLAGPWLILQKRRAHKVPDLIVCTYLVGLCFAVSLTFSIVSIDPIRPIIPLKIRYLIPFLPFAALMSVYLLSVCAPRILGKSHFKLERAGVLVFMLIMFTLPTWQLEFLNSKFSAFMWKAEKEYVEFSEKFIKGELLLTGKKKLVYPMIIKLRYPVKIEYRDQSVSATNISTDVLCVKWLKKVPLHLNYQRCTNQELSQVRIVPGT
jgi:hypothetical protein